jgi:hypothetical protein
MLSVWTAESNCYACERWLLMLPQVSQNLGMSFTPHLTQIYPFLSSIVIYLAFCLCLPNGAPLSRYQTDLFRIGAVIDRSNDWQTGLSLPMLGHFVHIIWRWRNARSKVYWPLMLAGYFPCYRDSFTFSLTTSHGVTSCNSNLQGIVILRGPKRADTLPLIFL